MILKAGALSYTIQLNYTETMGSLEQINYPGKGVLMGKMGITESFPESVTGLSEIIHSRSL